MFYTFIGKLALCNSLIKVLKYPIYCFEMSNFNINLHTSKYLYPKNEFKVL